MGIVGPFLIPTSTTLTVPHTPPRFQVHLAKMNGQKVVVKVQRPGLKELFDIDLKNIRALVGAEGLVGVLLGSQSND